MSELRISYEPDDEWSGKMTVRVVSDGFAGATSAWIATRYDRRAIHYLAFIQLVAVMLWLR